MNIEEITDMAAFIRQNFSGLEVSLRPHPGMESKAKYQNIIDSYNIGFSDSKKYDAFSFLKNVDAVISGNSSILLEAALQNVFPIYYYSPKTVFYFTHDRYDKYDYVKNKIAVHVDNLETLGDLLTDLIRKKPNIRQYAKYYCDTIGTANEGKSAALAANIILKEIGFV
jgi:predicted glycosyltransferase